MEHVDIAPDDEQPQPTLIPEWVVLEVGRLHLDNLALRREINAPKEERDG